MEREFKNAADTPELWRLLVTEGGLQADDYDAPLVDYLRAELGLLGVAPLESELATVPMERFVEAFFVGIAPYVAMWSDLLALFERAAATVGELNLRIAYRFEESDDLDLDFDLNHFRRVKEVIELLQARFDLSGATLAGLWAVPEAVPDRGNWIPPSGSPAADTFFEIRSDRSRPWPSALPTRPVSVYGGLDPMLAEAWALLEVVFDGVRLLGPNHALVMETWGEDDQAPLVAGANRGLVRQVESDFWPSTTAVALTRATRALDASAASELAARLEEALAPLRNRDPRVIEPRRRLEEFLQLPIWTHRYELYSNWVCTQVLAALDDRKPLLHVDRGAIAFSFSGTHLATFDGFQPRLHLWTEFRTPLATPIGTGRKASIQPDIALLSDPITARRSPLVIECKQYRRASNQKFAAALTDYARGHVDAQIVLVDYGPARAASILKRVAADVVERAVVIGDLRPGERGPVDDFRRQVRTGVRVPLQVVPARALEVPTRITLSWGPSPRDLDLHIAIVTTDQEDVHVSFETLGELDQYPYCRLDRDVTGGTGPEVVTIARWLPAVYTVVVHNYSNEAPLGESSAKVTLESGGERHKFSCPANLEVREWIVCSIDGQAGMLTPSS